MTKNEVLQMCLEHIETDKHECSYIHHAIKAALAQPEQEPVAWMTINAYGEEDDIHYENPEDHLMEGWTYKPLYTHPPQTQQAQSEPLEYWNAVEGWVKIDEVREHFDSVGCGTIYKTAGEDRVPVYAVPPPCPTCEALARTVMLDQTSHDTTPPVGDIRALKHRIHELEGELMGYKKIVADQDAMLERQTARIVELQEHIENFDGEDR